MGIATIAAVLALLMYLAFRGVSVLVLAPLLAALAAVLSGVPVLGAYTQLFMKAAGGFITTYFPLFLLGAIFGKLMELSGAAQTIGRWCVERFGQTHAVLAIVASCAILTYGGVSLFVVAFAVYPVAAALFRAADLPARLIPGAIALGAFTFTMTALPGTPAIQNAIPMPYFGTTPFAAPALGVVAAVVMAAVGYLWLNRRTAAARARGEGYGEVEGPEPALRHIRNRSQGEGFDLAEIGPAEGEEVASVNFAVALAPIVLVVALNYLFSRIVLPGLDLSYLAEPAWGGAAPRDVIGVWSIVASLSIACLLILALHPGAVRRLLGGLGDGANAAVGPIFNTASLVGFGAVVAALPAFAELRDSILSVAPGNPLISLSISVNVLAGITGSASGGMSIALEALGTRYLDLGTAAGIDPAVLHRVTAVATGGLDALPHNGAVVTLLAICKMSHARSYLDIFVVAVAGPLLALAAIVALATF